MDSIDGVPTSVNGKTMPTPGIDVTAAPDFWLTKPAEIRQFLESLDGVEIEVIGQTAGGREIIAASVGEREMLEGRTCNTLGSAVAGSDARAFYGQGERKHPSLLFVGAAHGIEYDGTVAALNYLNIIVTGKDLRGREQPEMAAEGRKMRFTVIPFLNVDGRERVLNHVNIIDVDPDYFALISQGVWQDGELLRYPASKRIQPMTTKDFAFIGSYCNDAGINLVYDAALGPDMQPENAALLRYCRREMPDCVLLSHSNNGTLVEPASAFIPEHFRERIVQIGALAGMRCKRAGFAKHNCTHPRWDWFYYHQYYQTDAVYHACGALPLLVEFPCGWVARPPKHEDLLEISLAALDEIFAFGNRFPFRPRGPYEAP